MTPYFRIRGVLGPIAALAMAAAAACSNPVSTEAPKDTGQTEYQRQMALDQSEHPTLKPGAAMPDFELKGSDGKTHTAAEYKDAQILVVAFISNHCPASQIYEGRIQRIANDYAAKGVKLIAIQPDGPKATAPSELNFSDLDDSYESMIQRAKFRKFTFPYLYDGDEQKVSHAFGPKVTPHIFVFDNDRKLAFEGRIDDSLIEAKAKTRETRDAIEALLAGKAPPVNHTAVFGCSTKWNNETKMGNVEKQIAEWKARPVTVETVTLAGLKDLRKNPTGKYLMVNFWATWCGPCKLEMPDMIQSYQWYNDRNFDFVTVSVDKPSVRANVERFLKQIHAPVRNLQVDSEDLFAIQKAFDETWESGVPFTMVIAPDGRVIYRKEGENDILRLRRTILANLPDDGPFAGNADYWKQ